MPKKQIGKKIDVNGNQEDLGYTLNDEEVAKIKEIDSKADKKTTINNKPLSSNITLNATDVGALSSDTPVVKYGFTSSPAKEGDLPLINMTLYDTSNNLTGMFQVDTAQEGFGTYIGVISTDGSNSSVVMGSSGQEEKMVVLDSSGNIQKINASTGEVNVVTLPSKSGTIATTDDLPDTSSFIDKNVNNLINYTNNSDLNNLLNQKQNTITSSNKLSNTLISGLGTASTLNTGTSSGNVPVLGSDGKLPSSVVPASAITDTFVVNSSSAQLALTAQVGDVCVRTDLNKSYILKAEPASNVNNWQELLTPTDAITSVNGQTGAVYLDATSVGAVPNNTAFFVKSVNGKTGDVTGLATTDVATTSNAGLMSSSDKTKLNGIATGAEANVQSDWNEASSTSDAYIKNKPSVPAKYDATKTYKSGDMVLYVNRIFEYRYSTPSAGNAPPTAEAEQSNTYWISTNAYKSYKVFVGEIAGDTNSNQSPLVFRSSNTSYGDTLYRSSKVYVDTDFKLHDSGGEVANTSYVDTKVSTKLDKVTYEYNKELAIGSTGKVLVGKFPMYDSNVTINVSSTTNTTYNGTLVIASQNINDAHGGSYVANVYGDPTGTLSSAFVVKYPTNSRVFEVYCNFPSWSKNLIHIKAVALSSAPSNIVELVTTIPTDSLVTVNNVLKNTFLTGITSAQVTSALGYTPYNSTNPNGYVTSSGSVANATKLNNQDASYYLNYNNFTNKPTIPTIPTNYVTTNTEQTITGNKTFSGNGLTVSGRTLNAGDDEGIVVSTASNSYAGLCLGSPSGMRSVFYLNTSNGNAWWRYNAGGATSYDLQHPKKSGTIATTDDLGTQATYSLSGTTLTITPK